MTAPIVSVSADAPAHTPAAPSRNSGEPAVQLGGDEQAELARLRIEVQPHELCSTRRELPSGAGRPGNAARTSLTAMGVRRPGIRRPSCGTR